MVNYFELYDIPESFRPDRDAVKAKFYELSKKYHPDRFTLASSEEQAEALQYSSENNDAYKVLNSDDATMKYILQQQGVIEEEEKYNLPPDFLMEMMELNEAVSEAEMDESNMQLQNDARNMLSEQLNIWQQETQPLTEKYDPTNPDKELLLAIKDRYYRKKYLLRISERLKGLAGN